MTGLWYPCYKRQNVQHKKKRSVGSFICPSCTNFSTKSRPEMNYHIAKKHSEATAGAVHKCKKCDFRSFYNLPEHNWKEH